MSLFPTCPVSSAACLANVPSRRVKLCNKVDTFHFTAWQHVKNNTNSFDCDRYRTPVSGVAAEISTNGPPILEWNTIIFRRILYSVITKFWQQSSNCKSFKMITRTSKIGPSISHFTASQCANHVSLNISEYVSFLVCYGVRTLVAIHTSIFKNLLDRSGFEPVTFGLPAVWLIRSPTRLLIYLKS